MQRGGSERSRTLLWSLQHAQYGALDPAVHRQVAPLSRQRAARQDHIVEV
jgi:hypothetical protein